MKRSTLIFNVYPDDGFQEDSNAAASILVSDQLSPLAVEARTGIV